ncbi:hypothetical protein [Companilactobacillus ginsenosidimutans]|uniref:Surface layer protein A domain-containing protein n=1 Tax=Companilactobacillus ginsenosidimutans TaxID=1007676 RepID=A0A0H4QIC2_9LACO|nr:hypothetical protein [Companilactobacillus ginsenosidimutans]AKP67697.1 hypothetical protein ABM34_09260 [Companilactobacillus ginsenosidimutans]
MNKKIIAIIGAFFLMIVPFTVQNVAQADNTDSTTSQQSEYQQAAQDFVDNYVNKDITVTNGDLSLRNINNNYYTSGKLLSAYNDSYKNGITEYLIKDYTNSSYLKYYDNLNFGAYRLNPKTKEPITDVNNIGNSHLQDGLEFFVSDGDKILASTRINVTLNNKTVHEFKGTVINNDKLSPLIDEANADGKSNRSVAPETGWYTDKMELNLNNGNYQYRVSTSEWLQGDVTIKSDDQQDIHLKTSPFEGLRPTYHVTGKSFAGENLYKSDGSVWNYTLPTDSDWQTTAFATDQNGFLYYQVSTNAWVRVNNPQVSYI